jgi:hypothetical protein
MRSPPISLIVLGSMLIVRNSLVEYNTTPPATNAVVREYGELHSSRQWPVVDSLCSVKFTTADPLNHVPYG